MAQRQSLKDLQNRLARRLTAAKTEAATASWLAVEAGRQRYLLPLVQSGEIFSWAPVQTVPYTQPWYLGVASLRGGVQGVIDLAALPGLKRPDVGSVSGRTSADTRLVSLHPALDVNAVLCVDRLLGLRNPAMFRALGALPEDAPGFLGRVLLDAQGESWQELDLQILSGEPMFLNIAAA
jgi:twitching motility protein PilI